jgi:hypothetical protein
MNYLIPFLLILSLGLKSEKIIEPPIPILPYNETIITKGDVTFSWTETNKKHIYEIIISQDIDFTNPLRYSTSDTTIVIPITYISGDFYWKVRAFKNKKNYSDWSLTFCCHLYENQQQDNSILAPCGRIGGCRGCMSPCGRRSYQNFDIKTE